MPWLDTAQVYNIPSRQTQLYETQVFILICLRDNIFQV